MDVRAWPVFGRPRAFSICFALVAPKISGNTSCAGRALAKVAFVHSGFSRAFRFWSDFRFIMFHLASIGFSQADHVHPTRARREDQRVQTPGNEAERLKALLSLFPTEVLNDKRRVPLELRRRCKRNAALSDISFVLSRVETDGHSLLYIRIYNNATSRRCVLADPNLPAGTPVAAPRP